MSSEYLTMAEIEARYPNRWVLIDRPNLDRHQNLLGGYVLRHGTTQDGFDEAVAALPRPIRIAVEYTGPLIDDDMEAVL